MSMAAAVGSGVTRRSIEPALGWGSVASGVLAHDMVDRTCTHLESVRWPGVVCTACMGSS